MILAVIILLSWLFLLWFSADKLINSSVRVAKIFKLSPLFIGLTILAIGTSAPELFLSAMSAINWSWSLSVGNIVGSNIFNLWFILWLSAVFAPIVIQKKLVYRDWIFLFLISCLLFVFLRDHKILWREWAVCLGLLVCYNWYLWVKKDPMEEVWNANGVELPEIKNFWYLFVCIFALSIININTENWFNIGFWLSTYSVIFMCVILILFCVSMFNKKKQRRKEHENWILLNITKIIASIGLLIMSSDVIVASAVYVATVIWVSEWAIWATIIAAGTSLPEMAATLAAIIKKKYDMWVWNVIGSDIFNILWIVWISSVITELDLSPKCLAWSCDSVLWSLMYDNIFSMFILILTLVVTLIFMRTWWKLSKSEWLFLFLFACLRMAFELVPQYFRILSHFLVYSLTFTIFCV